MPKIAYMCDYCGSYWDELKDVYDCELQHCKASDVITAENENNKGLKYPIEILVMYEDGRGYKYQVETNDEPLYFSKEQVPIGDIKYHYTLNGYEYKKDKAEWLTITFEDYRQMDYYLID